MPCTIGLVPKFIALPFERTCHVRTQVLHSRALDSARPGAEMPCLTQQFEPLTKWLATHLPVVSRSFGRNTQLVPEARLWWYRDFKRQGHVVAQTRSDPVPVLPDRQGEGRVRPLLGHEHVVNVIPGRFSIVVKVRRFGLVSGFYTMRCMVRTHETETCQIAYCVGVINRPAWPVPADMIVEVTRNDRRG